MTGFLSAIGWVFFFFWLTGYFIFSGVSVLYIWGNLLLAVLCWGVSLISLQTADESPLAQQRTYRLFPHLLVLACFLGFVVLANLLLHSRFPQWDTTEQGVFKLAPVSLEVLESLNQEVHSVFVVTPESTAREKEVIRLFERAGNTLLTVHRVDPILEPETIERFAVPAGAKGVVFEPDSKRKRVLYRLDEQEVTNAIRFAAGSELKKFALITGHDAFSFDPEDRKSLFSFRELLLSEGISLELRSLVSEAELSAAGVVLFSGEKEFGEGERTKIREYLRQPKSSVMVFLEPGEGASLRSLLNEFGVSAPQAIVVQPVTSTQGQLSASLELIQKVNRHPITASFNEDHLVSFFLANPLQLIERDSWTARSLLSPDSRAWGEVDLSAFSDPSAPRVMQDSEDVLPPFELAVTLEHDKLDSRILVFGDSSWVTNQYLSRFFNSELLRSSVRWSTGGDSFIALPLRTYRPSELSFPRESLSLILSLTLVIPQLVLLGGLFLLYRRRRRRESPVF